MKGEQGFSSAEVLIAAGIALVMLAGSMSSFNDSLTSNEKTAQMTDLGQNMRAGMNLLAEDFMRAGWSIPEGGIPIPSGAGATPVLRPSPPGMSYTFTDPTMAAVTPGAGMGPIGLGHATDMVSILTGDGTLPLNQTPLTAVGPNGSTITVDPGTPISGVSNPIVPGDLIELSNANGNTLQYVTRVAGQVISFAPGDPMNLNQPAAPTGSVSQLENNGVFPPTTAMRVYLVTYYLDFTVDPNTPRLTRRINNGPGEAVALVVEDLQLSYDLVDGATNPTNVKAPAPPSGDSQIRKANILLSGRSSSVMRQTGQFLYRNLTTAVSLRSLSYIDRYN